MNEQGYLDLLDMIVKNGELKDNRTAVSTISVFGTHLRYNTYGNKLPIMTTKKVNYDLVIDELLFFLSGKTDTNMLKSNIWKGNTSEEFLHCRGLDYKEGDMGPGYGFQWRHWGEEYRGCNLPEGDSYKGIDQIRWLINEIKTNPSSRRLIVSCWNVSALDKMALPPCHMMFQVNIRNLKDRGNNGDNEGSRGIMDLLLYQRSADMFLGVPFNVTSYSVLLHILCKLTGYIPGDFIHNMGDTHIYTDHLEAVETQLGRLPYPYPTIKILDFNDIDELTREHIIIEGYEHHPFIKAKMAI